MKKLKLESKRKTSIKNYNMNEGKISKAKPPKKAHKYRAGL